jgi:hypothetical protein
LLDIQIPPQPGLPVDERLRIVQVWTTARWRWSAAGGGNAGEVGFTDLPKDQLSRFV